MLPFFMLWPSNFNEIAWMEHACIGIEKIYKRRRYRECHFVAWCCEIFFFASSNGCCSHRGSWAQPRTHSTSYVICCCIICKWWHIFLSINLPSIFNYFKEQKQSSVATEFFSSQDENRWANNTQLNGMFYCLQLPAALAWNLIRYYIASKVQLGFAW